MVKSKFSINVWKLVIIILIVSVLFENMKIVSVLGSSFKITHIVLIIAILAGLRQRIVRQRDFLIGVFLLILPCLPLYRINDKTEWFKSYVIYAMLILFLVFAYRRTILEFKKYYKGYVRLLLSIIAITQILGIIQFICMNYFNYFFLLDVFGSLAFQKNIFNMYNGFYRAFSIYHEPSFFGLVTLTGVTVLFLVGKKVCSLHVYRALLILSILAVLVSLSASCLVIFLVLIIFKQFIEKKPSKTKIVSISVLFCALTYLALYTSLLSPVMRLFTETNRVNSSGYERTTTQWMYVKKTMWNYPILGRGIGQQGNVDAVGIIGLYPAINNSLAGIVVNFGLSSLCIILPLVIGAIKKIKIDKIWILIVITIVGIYASTGAYISVDTFNMVILLCAVGTAGQRE